MTRTVRRGGETRGRGGEGCRGGIGGKGRGEGRGRGGGEGRDNKKVFFLCLNLEDYLLNELSYDVLIHLILNISKRSFQRI